MSPKSTSRAFPPTHRPPKTQLRWPRAARCAAVARSLRRPALAEAFFGFHDVLFHDDSPCRDCSARRRPVWLRSIAFVQVFIYARIARSVMSPGNVDSWLPGIEFCTTTCSLSRDPWFKSRVMQNSNSNPRHVLARPTSAPISQPRSKIPKVVLFAPPKLKLSREIRSFRKNRAARFAPFCHLTRQKSLCFSLQVVRSSSVGVLTRLFQTQSMRPEQVRRAARSLCLYDFRPDWPASKTPEINGPVGVERPVHNSLFLRIELYKYILTCQGFSRRARKTLLASVQAPDASRLLLGK